MRVANNYAPLSSFSFYLPVQISCHTVGSREAWVRGQVTSQQIAYSWGNGVPYSCMVTGETELFCILCPYLGWGGTGR